MTVKKKKNSLYIGSFFALTGVK